MLVIFPGPGLGLYLVYFHILLREIYKFTLVLLNCDMESPPGNTCHSHPPKKNQNSINNNNKKQHKNQLQKIQLQKTHKIQNKQRTKKKTKKTQL